MLTLPDLIFSRKNEGDKKRALLQGILGVSNINKLEFFTRIWRPGNFNLVTGESLGANS